MADCILLRRVISWSSSIVVFMIEHGDGDSPTKSHSFFLIDK